YNWIAERASLEYFWTASLMKEHPATQAGYEASVAMGKGLQSLARYPEERERAERIRGLTRLVRKTQRILVRVRRAGLPPDLEREIIGAEGHLTQALKAVRAMRQVMASSLGSSEERVVHGTTWEIARIYPPAERETALRRLGILAIAPRVSAPSLAGSDEFGVAAAETDSLETVARMEIPLSLQKNRMLIVAYAGPARPGRLEALNREYERKLEGRLIVVRAADYAAFLRDLLRGENGMDRVRLRAQRFFRRSGHRGILAQKEFLKYLTVVAFEEIAASLEAPFVLPFYRREFAWPREVREFAEIFYAVTSSGLSGAQLLKQKVGDSLEIHWEDRGRGVAFLALNAKLLGRYLELLEAVRSAEAALAAAA
ncbi:MAG: hypothetical protein HY714_03095, partial [Candidatus Omnitrophica bacterium]|nr:hypothetical protein [Candidatus Omnitrophota bacterium]